MVIDMMVYALERPRTTTVFLISRDGDNAYAISTLRNRGYPVKLLAPAGHLHPGLQALADVLDWNAIFRPDLPPSELIDFGALGKAGESEEESEEEESEEESEEEEEEEDEEEEDEEEQAKEEGTQGQPEASVQVEVVKEAVVKAAPEADPEVELLVDTVREETKQEAPEVKLVPFEFTSSPPPSATWSEPTTPQAPAKILPTWSPPPPASPPAIVPLKPLSTPAQSKPVAIPLPPPSASPAPSTQPTTAPPSYAGGSSPPGVGGHPIEQPAARYVPAKFLVLVQELEAKKAQGILAPTWSTISPAVKKRLPSVLEKAGVRWKDYMLLAEKGGIVTLKMERAGTDTVSLKI